MNGEIINPMIDKIIEMVLDVSFYNQLGVIFVIYAIAFVISVRIRKHISVFNSSPPKEELNPLKEILFRSRKLLFPVIALFLLRLSLEFTSIYIGDIFMKGALAIGLLLLYNSFIHLFVIGRVPIAVFRWIGFPIIFFHSIGVLSDIVKALDSISIEIGNIKLSAFIIFRTLIFGSLLFWLGRISNTTGKKIIRKQEKLDYRTREFFAKLFEITMFVLVVILLMQLLGVNLTAFAVFGGAVGVGLGFGLQAITSNFISGLIIIFDRSVSIGDYIELEDGRTGTVTHLNMRSTTLETFDGKDIVVPNEKFISSSFTNWTHKHIKQRYRVDFSVSYTTNVRDVVELIKDVVSEHPRVISGNNVSAEEMPDCEIDSFGDSGINMFVEFWMEGVDDGKNRVGGDLLLLILETLQKHKIEIPYPQREIRILETLPK